MLPLYTQSAAASIIDQINQAIVDTYGEEFRDRFVKSIDTDGDGVEDAALNQDLFNNGLPGTCPFGIICPFNKRIIVYGEPFGCSDDQGHRRYLGYTYLGEKYTNTLFRHDAFAGGRFRVRNWLYNPETVKELKPCCFTEEIRRDPHLREEIWQAALLGLFSTTQFKEAESFEGVFGGIEGIKAIIQIKIDTGQTCAAMELLRDIRWFEKLADYIY